MIHLGHKEARFNSLGTALNKFKEKAADVIEELRASAPDSILFCEFEGCPEAQPNPTLSAAEDELMKMMICRVCKRMLPVIDPDMGTCMRCMDENSKKTLTLSPLPTPRHAPT